MRCMAPSPALDVVGVGLADGRVVLHNVRYDEQVAAFDNAAGAGLAAEGLLGGGAGTALAAGGSGGAVTALSFRSGAGVPLLAAGGGGGVVTVWNLEERRLHTVIRDAHAGPLVGGWRCWWWVGVWWCGTGWMGIAVHEHSNTAAVQGGSRSGWLPCAVRGPARKSGVCGQ